VNNLRYIYKDGGHDDFGLIEIGNYDSDDERLVRKSVVKIGDEEEIMGVIGQRGSKDCGGYYKKVSFMISRYVKLY
jgi:hypothetical protein